MTTSRAAHMAGPKCRWCGKTIPKKTVRVYRQGLPDDTTIADAQQFSNHAVISLLRQVKGSDRSRAKFRRERGLGYHILGFVVWDGETYTDPFFCKGLCAAAFGRDRAAAEAQNAS